MTSTTEVTCIFLSEVYILLSMATFLFKLPDSDLNSLRGVSRDSGVPVSRILRDLVREFLESRSPCGIVCSGTVASGTVYIMKG